jgi:hypothetical protein
VSGGVASASCCPRERAEADLLGDPRAERVGNVLHPFDPDAGVVGGLPALDLLLGEFEAVG